jgi:hypothetical protein
MTLTLKRIHSSSSKSSLLRIIRNQFRHPRYRRREAYSAANCLSQAAKTMAYANQTEEEEEPSLASAKSHIYSRIYTKGKCTGLDSVIREGCGSYANIYKDLEPMLN